MFIAPNSVPDIHDPGWGRTRVADGFVGFSVSVFDE
ncbi:hypothetical protein CYPRO_2401 [Cyclonatronum proteinivorum]|uniref:Uncharacterized protein n=1 Tax=Cyclonatronum proteinivorum TaxID=1457365 RepID=A0A345UME1_9BACT|nr:hypothetical protein CYPRO_2401 [Cyclonatronum proteinivorum]